MSAAFAIRDQMNDIEEAPGKVWFWELERAVIDAGRCIECGACIAACPSDSLGIGADDMPKLVKMCTGCSLCWDFCPRGGLRYEALGNCAGRVDAGGDGEDCLPTAMGMRPSPQRHPRYPVPLRREKASLTSKPVAGSIFLLMRAGEVVAVASATTDTIVAEIPKTAWKITGNGP